MMLKLALFLSLAVRVAAQTEDGKLRRQLAAKAKVCHFPPGNKSNFKTLSVGQGAVAAHLNHGDLLGSCEDNCFDICFGKDSPLEEPFPVQECLQRCSNGSGVAVVVSGSTPDLEVVSCDPSTVQIQGAHASDIAPGYIFVYVNGDIRSCASCSPLFRKVTSVTDGQVPGTKILSTTFATVGEILGNDAVSPSIQDEPIEPVAGCPHSGGGSRQLVTYDHPLHRRDAVEGDNAHHHQRQLQSFPPVCPTWRTKNPDGRCTYTNCYVGEDGDPNDCFACKDDCGRSGCGADGSVLNVSGNFGIFDFGEACCIHDYCYSSTFGKATCDLAFYEDMVVQCPPIPLVALIFLPVPLRVILGSCDVLASAFYLAVALGGGSAFTSAKAGQQAYEKTDICVAKCPSTQRSGGQGTTTLVIDLLKTSGTFPVTYQMYGIPDQLYITYEGTRIFDTGGLVSGGSTVNVNFSGTTKLIEVTINAPNSGTAWDVSVGCPIVP